MAAFGLVYLETYDSLQSYFVLPVNAVQATNNITEVSITKVSVAPDQCYG